MNKGKAWGYGRVLAAGVLVCLSGCGKGSNPAPDSRQVLIRLTAANVVGLDAKYYLYRQPLNGSMQLYSTGGAVDNRQVDKDNKRQLIGEVSRVEIVFDAVKASNSVRPGPGAHYIAEILVDGTVTSRAVIDSTTPINANGNLFAVAEAEIR